MSTLATTPFLITVLIVLAILLLGLNAWQYRAARATRLDLAYLHDKLNVIVQQGSTESLMRVTGNPAIQTLLVDLNRLLEENRSIQASYTRTEQSIKKMLTNMSHDLKTPLTVVLGLLETLTQEQTMSEVEKLRLAEKVHNKAQEMLQLMNRFFDLARLESGDRDLPLSRIRIHEICKNSMLFFYDSITSQGFEAAVEIPEGNVYALGNEEALSRVLSNLISNAIRYGGDGKTVGLALRQDEAFVYIEVWDRGKGIEDRHQALVFERLYTLEDSRNHRFQGSGLGLTITKRLVELMGGTISLSSIPFERTVFTVRLTRLR